MTELTVMVPPLPHLTIQTTSEPSPRVADVLLTLNAGTFTLTWSETGAAPGTSTLVFIYFNGNILIPTGVAAGTETLSFPAYFEGDWHCTVRVFATSTSSEAKQSNTVNNL
jgi:hypothetical protein